MTNNLVPKFYRFGAFSALTLVAVFMLVATPSQAQPSQKSCKNPMSVSTHENVARMCDRIGTSFEFETWLNRSGNMCIVCAVEDVVSVQPPPWDDYSVIGAQACASSDVNRSNYIYRYYRQGSQKTKYYYVDGFLCEEHTNKFFRWDGDVLELYSCGGGWRGCARNTDYTGFIGRRLPDSPEGNQVYGVVYKYSLVQTVADAKGVSSYPWNLERLP